MYYEANHLIPKIHKAICIVIPVKAYDVTNKLIVNINNVM